MDSPPLIFGPIPPYNNPNINPQYFQPRIFEISAMTIGSTTTVTTSKNHNYVVGQLCRLIIGQTWGTSQLNEELGYVISIPAANQITLNINSQNANAFKTGIGTNPQIVPVGDVNTGLISTTGIQLPNGVVPYIPGSFQNISPAQV